MRVEFVPFDINQFMRLLGFDKGVKLENVTINGRTVTIAITVTETKK